MNLALQSGFVPAHQEALPYLVQENVSGLVGHAQVAAHLQGGNALHGVGEQDRRRKVQAKIVPDVTEKSSWQPAQRQILRVGRK